MKAIVDDKSTRPLLALCCLAAVFGLAGLLEGRFLLQGQSLDTSAALALGAGLGGVIGALAGLLSCLVLAPLTDAASPSRWYGRYLSRGESAASPAERVEWSAGSLAALSAVVALALWVGLFGGLAHDFNQRRLTMAFTALGGVTGACLGWMVWVVLKPVFRWALSKIAGDGRFIVSMPIGLVVVTLALGAAAVSRLDLGAYRLDRMAWPLGTFLMGVVLFAFVKKQGRRIRGPIYVIGWGSMVWSGVFTTSAQEWERRSVPIFKLGTTTHLALGGLRYFTDGDGDGTSSLFGGGDCDDSDPGIGPHAKEIPGNGIDENCRAGDAPLPKVVKPEPKPEPVVIAPRAEPKPYNIVFILIDTLRPDRMSLYGYKRKTTPNLKAFAGDALVFDHVYAQAPNTPRSMPSIFTGRYPSRVDWIKRYTNYGKLKPANETLFEIYGEAGWQTEAVSAHWYFDRAKGIKQGVQKWDNKGSKTVRESNTQSCAPLITKKLLRRLEVFEKDKRKFVIFAHYFDPHGRYMNHPKVKIFAKKGLSNRYDSEIAFVDHHLKPVLEKLNEGLLAKNTIVVITSDHGEAFREHGFNFHGRTVYDEEIKVPLLIRIPGIPGKRLKKPAGLVDLLPTLTELTGLKAARAQGESLVGLWTGRDPQPTGPIFMEQLPYPNYKTHIVAALSRQTRVKAIRNITDNVIEVFDLKSDPREKINLLDKNPNAGRKIRQQLEQFIDADPG